MKLYWPPVPPELAPKPERRTLRPRPEKDYRPRKLTKEEAAALLARTRVELAAQIQAAIAERATARPFRMKPQETARFLGNV